MQVNVPSISCLADLATSREELDILEELLPMSITDDLPLYFAWNPPAIVAAHTALGALGFAAAPLPFTIPAAATLMQYESAILAHVAAEAMPGVLVIPTALGLTCVGASFGRATSAMQRLADSPWAAALNVILPPGLGPLAFVYTLSSASAAAAARGEVERVFSPAYPCGRIFA